MARVDSIAAELAQGGFNTSRISQSSLIFREPIIAGNGTYTFRVLQNQPPVLPGEIRLALQDLFVVTTMALCFSGTYNVVGPPALQNRALFFAPPVQMSVTALPLFELYNGQLRCNINEVTYLSNWDTQRHLYAGQTGILGFVGASTDFYQAQQLEGSKSGFFPVEPGIVLNGNAKNDFVLQLANNTLAPVLNLPFEDPQGVQATINIDEIALVCRGYLAQNASTSN
jgi:hypothetical protein